MAATVASMMVALAAPRPIWPRVKLMAYMKVAGTLEKVRDEFSGDPGTTDFQIRKGIERHFDIEMVNEQVFTYKDVVIKKDGGTFVVTASYEDTAPFVANIYFLVAFDKTVEIESR